MIDMPGVMHHGYPYFMLIECAERELRFRKRLYARWVEKLKMSPKKAELEITMMAAIVYELKRLEKRHERLPL